MSPTKDERSSSFPGMVVVESTTARAVAVRLFQLKDIEGEEEEEEEQG